MKISLTKNLERKKKEQIQGRTNRRMPIFNPTIQLVVVNLYTKYRLLINSLFGVFYSYFWAGDSCFSRISSNLHCGTPTFSKRCPWDSYFQNPSENPANMKFLSKTVVEISLTKKSYGITEGRTEPQTDVNQYTPHFFKAGV